MCCSSGLFFPFSHPTVKYTASEESIGLVLISPYSIGGVGAIQGSYHSVIVDGVPFKWAGYETGYIHVWISASHSA